MKMPRRKTLGLKERNVMKQQSNGDNGRRTNWKEFLSSYPELSELRFRTAKENRKALDLLDDELLREMPYDLTGDGIVVPAEAVPYFKNIGRFTERKVSLS